MFRYSLPLAMILAFACTAIPTRAAQQPQQRPPQIKRVWTTNDMDDLRARGLISIVGTEPEAVPAPAVAPAPTPGLVYAGRTEDPAWYAEQAGGLQAQLSAQQAAAAQAQDNLDQVRNQITNVLLPLERDQLLSREGKKKLKKALIERLNVWLPKGKVDDVFFSKLLLG